jgi:hypothetical protein
LDLGKPLLEPIPCVEVTFVSKFHPIWCLVAQESKLRRMFLGGSDISDSFSRYIHQNRTYQSRDGHVHWTVFGLTSIHCFSRILLTECPFDLILLPLAS